MKKLMSLVIVSLMLVALFLVGCGTEEATDESLEASIAEMTDEELEAVVESTEESGALAGQAVRMTDRTKLMASKELIKRYKIAPQIGTITAGPESYSIDTEGNVQLKEEFIMKMNDVLKQNMGDLIKIDDPPCVCNKILDGCYCNKGGCSC